MCDRQCRSLLTARTCVVLKKLAVVKWCAFVSGGGSGGRVAAEGGSVPPPPPRSQAAWGGGESAAEDFPRPRARPRRR